MRERRAGSTGAEKVVPANTREHRRTRIFSGECFLPHSMCYLGTRTIHN